MTDLVGAPIFALKVPREIRMRRESNLGAAFS